MQYSRYLLALWLCFAWLPFAKAQAPLQLMTESYPPFNMAKSGRTTETYAPMIQGIATDMVKELFKRAEIPYTLRMILWRHAYALAQNEPGYGLFSTTRTPNREKLFQWVGPLVENNWVFMAKKSRHITLNSLDDARSYKVGSYTGDAVANFLQGEEFIVELASLDSSNPKRLEQEKIDLWATGHLLGPYLAKQMGVADLEAVYTFKTTQMYLALNHSVPQETIERLNAILVEMRKDGTVQALHDRYIQ
ncbi:amino acid ABC transporter substrate-binding protein, PAAT family [Magnetococcus marinus MC-1]|uniref:Amino acid ABC transporter substrate-binding protein, PAAT family n=1 Tax=Magnetococcus marinus (strain ATCC BAA-1437 / JCM 17883 / MC-1) TaxID=156889 RepID=A0L597_MAGMM|nr:ABC transporter substrate-binding protein [Magnetococcus marinus]ABK43140.1 amino acid ABC transporter substrate-binding protein, PAAT family [Magnetococcus marinus MC-1]